MTFQTRKNTASLNKAISNSAIGKEPVVNILSFDVIGAGMARVLCGVTHAGDSREDHSKISNALRTRLQGKMEAVAGSFSSVDKGQYQEQITGIVSVVKEAIPVTKENLVGFRAVAANMFMDDEQDMWVVRKSAAGDLIVKTTGIEDDMSLVRLLNQSCSHSTNHSSISEQRRMVARASAVCDTVKGGDFVSYVNMNNELTCGFLVATAFDEAHPEVHQAVVLPINGEEEVINVKAVIDNHDQTSFPALELSEQETVDAAVASARGSVNLQTLLDYYKKVYARRPAFYAEFAKRIKAHAFV